MELKPFQDELLTEIKTLVEQSQKQVAVQVNSALTLTYWQVGKKIDDYILKHQRATYAKEIVATLSKRLVELFGKSFETKNLRRMIQFSQVFPKFEIVVPLARQLSWSHFIILIPLKNEEARLFYAQKSLESSWGKRELKNQIERKVYERTEIAKIQTPIAIEDKKQDTTIFKDPYFLDFLGLKEGYMEKDIESAIIKELETFILELGVGFSFIERQKRIILDGKDFYLDLLFYHRKLKRLVAIELKLGEFKPSHKGQMELYLKWLDRYEKQEDENSPIGLILCAEASKEQIELLEMHKNGIMVAEYWAELPPKKQLEQKLHTALIEAKERIESKRLH